MILTCPSCGASASLEAWANDREWRDLIALLPKIPAQLQGRAISYLGLFRSGSSAAKRRALKPAKAFKVLTGLLDLVNAGTVHWEQGETRPAPVDLWAEALDAVIERRPGALTNHNYLKHTAWDMAAGLVAEAEAVRLKAEGSARNLKVSPQSSVLSPEGAPRRRGCFCCESFRPPKGCAAKSRPASGNQMLGCGQWKEKAAGAIGNLMTEIVGGASFHHEDHEGLTKREGE